MDVEFVSQSSHGHGSLRGRSRLGKYSTASGCRRRSPWPKSIDDAGRGQRASRGSKGQSYKIHVDVRAHGLCRTEVLM